MPAIVLALLPVLLPVIEKLIAAIVAQTGAPVIAQSPSERAMTLATMHVTNMEQANISSDQKRILARQALAADLTREGLTLSGAEQNLLIEIAYNALKAAPLAPSAGAA